MPGRIVFIAPGIHIFYCLLLIGNIINYPAEIIYER